MIFPLISFLSSFLSYIFLFFPFHSLPRNFSLPIFILDWVEPQNPNSADDVAAAQRGMDFECGWFAGMYFSFLSFFLAFSLLFLPLFLSFGLFSSHFRSVLFQIDPLYFGDWPQSMKDSVGDRLPVFTSEQSYLLTHSHDYFGLNHYTSRYATTLGSFSFLFFLFFSPSPLSLLFPNLISLLHLISPWYPNPCVPRLLLGHASQRDTICLRWLFDWPNGLGSFFSLFLLVNSSPFLPPFVL